MGEDIAFGPAGEVERGAARPEAEALGGKVRAALALEHVVETRAQAVKVGHVLGRVGELRRTQCFRTPIGGLHLLV